ncbi:MAG: putative thermolysin family peptidase, partial [Frankiales bacterium]|nr:putative thermolysin family peptidase [Frankiales bacterium]
MVSSGGSLVRRLAAPALLVVCASLVLTPMPAHAQPRAGSGADELNARAGHAATFGRQGRTGQLSFVGTRPGRPAQRPADIRSTDAPAVAAHRWMTRYGGLFGVADPTRNLHVLRQSKAGPSTIVAFQQTVQGLPVVGGQLVVTVDGANNLVSVNGEALPVVSVPTEKRLSAATAARLAVQRLARSHPGARLVATTPVLSVLDQRLLGGVAVGGPATVWATTVSTTDSTVRHQVYLDAARGGVLLDLDLNPRAKDRLVCSAGSLPSDDPSCPGPAVTQVGSETSPPDGTDVDATDAYRFSGAVYDFYSTLLGRDGIDGQGGALRSTVHFCPAPDSCPNFDNAFWTGREMVYGNGYASALDVVAHELAHGITEQTSNLFSYYQSGAINESISDVMGELVQQIQGPALNAPGKTDVYDPAKAWFVGEQLPGASFTRDMADPTRNSPADPDRMTSPSYSAYLPWQDAFDNGGVHANGGVNNKAAYLMAVGGSFNGQTLVGMSGADQVEKNVKVANIYYQVGLLLTPASDYADLFRVLPQACNDVRAKGDLPLPVAGTTTRVSEADCAEVTKAVTATEMDRQPTSAAAAVPAAALPVCTNGGTLSSLRFDNFDGTTSPLGARFARGQAGADASGRESFGQWWWSKEAIADYGPDAFVAPYASSGTGTLYGDNADPTTFDPFNDFYNRQDAAVRTSPVVARPGMFLSFKHAWEFEYFPYNGAVYSPDGGRLEYTVDTGAHWYDAGAASPVSKTALLVGGGYNGTISNTDGVVAGQVDANPLKGQRGFIRSSHGWTSSRVDLSALSGKTVQLRWRIGADEAGGSLGWHLDDVALYSCNPTTVTLTAPTAVLSGGSARLTARLVRAGTSSAVAAAPVQLWQRKHGTAAWTAVGMPRATNAAGNVVWEQKPAVNQDYQAKYAGAGGLAPSYAVKTVLVKATVSRGATPAALSSGRAFTVSGSVSPAHAGKQVLLQRYSSGAWHTVAKTALNGASRYSV